MRVVLVGNLKGGCGKTTIATHLASHWAVSGLAVSLADCDRQRSSLGWLRRRDPASPPIEGLDWSRDVGKLPKQRDCLVIDAPAAMHHKDMEELIDLADTVVVPVLPGAFDQEATAHFLKKISEVKAIRKNRRQVLIVGNRLRSGTKAVESLDVFFAGLGFPVIARLRDSQAYTHCAEIGSSVLESRERRVRDHARDWQPLLAALTDPA